MSFSVARGVSPTFLGRSQTLLCGAAFSASFHVDASSSIYGKPVNRQHNFISPMWQLPGKQTWSIDPYQSLQQLIPALCHFGYTERVVANVLHRAIEAVISGRSERLEQFGSDFYTACGLMFDSNCRQPFLRRDKGSGGELAFACSNPLFMEMVAPNLRAAKRKAVRSAINNTLTLFVGMNKDAFASIDQTLLLKAAGNRQFLHWAKLMGLDLRGLSAAGITEILSHLVERKSYQAVVQFYRCLLSQEEPPSNPEGTAAEVPVLDVNHLTLETRIRDTDWSLNHLVDLAVGQQSTPFLLEVLKTMPTERVAHEAFERLIAISPHTGLPVDEWASEVGRTLVAALQGRRQKRAPRAEWDESKSEDVGLNDTGSRQREEWAAGPHSAVSLTERGGEVMAPKEGQWEDCSERPPWSFTNSGKTERLFLKYEALQQSIRALKRPGQRVAPYPRMAGPTGPTRGAPLETLNAESPLLDPIAAIQLQETSYRVHQQIVNLYQRHTLTDGGEPSVSGRSFKDSACYSLGEDDDAHFHSRISWGNHNFFAEVNPSPLVGNVNPSLSPFLAFPLPLQNVHFVDGPSDLGEMYRHVKGCEVVGLNIEWGVVAQTVSLLSVATWNNVFLVDLAQLRDADQLYVDMAYDFITWLFKTANVTKITYKHQVDILRLGSSFAGCTLTCNNQSDEGNAVFKRHGSIRNVIDLADHRFMSGEMWHLSQDAELQPPDPSKAAELLKREEEINSVHFFTGRSSRRRKRGTRSRSSDTRYLSKTRFNGLSHMCEELLGGARLLPPYAATWSARPLALPLLLSAANSALIMLMLESALRKSGLEPSRIIGNTQGVFEAQVKSF